MKQLLCLLRLAQNYGFKGALLQGFCVFWFDPAQTLGENIREEQSSCGAELTHGPSVRVKRSG
jgi:hypothetical protein